MDLEDLVDLENDDIPDDITCKQFCKVILKAWRGICAVGFILLFMTGCLIALCTLIYGALTSYYSLFHNEADFPSIFK